MYIYQNHLGGGLYTSDSWLDPEWLYCEECGDSDTLLGDAETREEAYKLLKDENYDEGYIQEFLDEEFGAATHETVDYEEGSNGKCEKGE